MKLANKPCAVVLNAVPPRGGPAKDAQEAIAKYGVGVAPVHKDERRTSLFPSQIVLSEKFFNALESHSVPLDVRALGRYPMALDVYTWLAHRLCRLPSGQGDRI